MSAVYERPTLVEIGAFGRLTKDLPTGSCTDFFATGYAVLCMY